ncbi:hypothetical protein [Pseudomonas haemolytica]|uniref:Uncharacterized protein n=1 Tax=Pseudomonas haemolytica TaxID=2600065 RepID=A0A5P1DBV4_9PSED|nr:hypothetical protein [Pseudomonas haemolytica]MBJ2245425.1 hypothetical protein [Pseudomonas haemolytica]MBJ2273122.1 hypothetical protein [Pseudomonas haemolytica]MBK3450784.1 hypothetical protein [Pseudomonas haemolytica]MBK3460900.1 hypothetical protein [Pseudomonas haemolytica]MRJ37985.1 hypothetical protein [Pseudomonas haemolytica]
MQWFPTPPTDNLYKFFAISGLLMLGGALAIIVALAYLDYRTEKETDEALYNFSSTQNQSKYSARITALQSGLAHKDLIPNLSIELNNNLEFLKKVVDIQSMMGGTQKPREPDLLDITFSFVSAREWFSLVLLVLYAGIASTSSFLGLRYWYKRIQVPSERLNQLEEDIKKASLLKLQLEIAQLQPMSETVKKLFELGGLMRPPK